MGIRFYCGINEQKWNYHPVDPGEYVCISPTCGKFRKENRVFVPLGSKVLQDSGAFGDDPEHRLSYEDGLARQIRHAEKYQYTDMITHVTSYDLLIDEKWIDGVRHKQRWSESDAWKAVEITIGAAEYISKHRNEIPNDPGLVISAQGVSPNQYLECVKNIVLFMNLDRDILGLGGWCITGRMRKQMMPILRRTLSIVIPYIAGKGVKRVHIFGVVFPPALGHLLYICDQYGISVSTDSAGPNKKPALGAWGYGDWIDHDYKRPPTDIRGQERARHVQTVRDWLADLRNTQYYLPINGKDKSECSTSSCTLEQLRWQIWESIGLDKFLSSP